MGKPIVMSLDRSMASDYRGTAYFGFSACLPRTMLAEPLYYRLVAPPVPVGPDGAIGLADCGSRKVEAALRQAGFGPDRFVFADPSHLDEAIGPETKVFLFGSHDPLGRGPVSAMFTGLMGRPGDSYNAAAVGRLLAHPALAEHRPTVIAGGPGSWELAVDPAARQRLGVDCVLVGEGELAVFDLVRRALAGERLPPVVEGPTVPVESIPPLTRPTVNGVVEVTRGCGRGCSFCVPNQQQLRSLPLAQICADAALTGPANRGRVVLHAEDIFRYRARSRFEVDHDAVCQLFAAVTALPGIDSVGASHGTLTAAVSSPETLREVADILRIGRPGGPAGCGLQMGIETGSRRLARRHLAAKMRPYRSEDWPEVVLEGAEICRRHGFFACFTLVFGLPDENEDDIRETLALVRQLATFPSLIVPLFYVPMGITRRQTAPPPFTFAAMIPAHFELLQACWEQNYRHLGQVWDLYGHQERPLLKRVVSGLTRLSTAYLAHRTGRFTRAHGAPPSPTPHQTPTRARPPRPDPRWSATLSDSSGQ